MVCFTSAERIGGRPGGQSESLLGVMKNDSQGRAISRSQTTDAMPEIHAIVPTLALNWPLVYGEGHSVSFSERHHFGTRLHARTLFDQNKFAASEILSRLRQQNRNLDGKYMLPVQILVKAIEIAWSVSKQQRRRAALTGAMAQTNVGSVLPGIAHARTHDLIPSVGNFSEMRIKRCPQFGNDFRQGIAKVFVLAPAKAVTLHDYAAAEMLFGRVKGREPIALFRCQDFRNESVAMAIELLCNVRPIEGVDALSGVFSRNLLFACSSHDFLFPWSRSFRQLLMAAACWG